MSMTDKQAAELLKGSLDSLSSGRRTFAESILRAAYSQKGASDKQWYWIHKLAEELQATKPSAVSLTLPRIRILLRTAREAGIEKPKIRLTLPGGLGRIIIQTNRGSRIFINDAERKYFNNKKGREYAVTYGEIDPESLFVVSPYAKPEFINAVTDILSAFETDPAKVSSLEGHATGHCCFCARRLDNPESVKVGYGPICAERYGLAHGGTGATNSNNVWKALEDAGATAGDAPDADIPF